MSFLPGNRVRLIAEWAEEHVRGITGTVVETAESTVSPYIGALYAVEWDEPFPRSVMRDGDIEPENKPEAPRNPLLALAEFGPVYYPDDLRPEWYM